MDSLKKYSSEALVDAANEEQIKIETIVAERTIEAQVRTSLANAGKAESDVRKSLIEERILQTQELNARITPAQNLRHANSLPVRDDHGDMAILPAPKDYDWDGLVRSIATLQTQQAAPTLPIPHETTMPDPDSEPQSP